MTVKEIIDSLKILDPDLTVYVEDADTGWLLPNFKFADEGKWIEISADYEGRIKSRDELK